MSARDHIKLSTKLASALSILLDIPYEHQLLMHEEHVLSLVQWDHFPKRKADGGGDLFSNLQPLLIGAHHEKTTKRDIPEIAKGKRLRRKEAQHKVRLEIKAGRLVEDGPIPRSATAFPDRPKRKIVSRGFVKGHRPLRGGNSFQTRGRT